MRTFPLLVMIGVFGRAVEAQVTVEVVLGQEQFLRDESLPVKVRITNRSGQPLRLGADNTWLSLAVENLDQSPPATVGRVGELAVSGEFTVESAQVATRQVDLAPAFDLSQAGRYQVTATVSIRQWNEEFSSKPRPFEVVRGTKLWEQEFGVPMKDGPPESRKYALQQARYGKNLHLYLRLTDLEDQRVFRVSQLGPLVSFNHPEAQLDRAGYLHVLFQTGARSFLFNVITPEGDLVLRQSYDYSSTRPALRANEEGRIFVHGGVRRLHSSDLPASPSLAPGTNAPPAAATNAPAEAPARKSAKSSKS
jgi:hypothetical protein